MQRERGDRVEALRVVERLDLVQEEDRGLCHRFHRLGEAARRGRGDREPAPLDHAEDRGFDRLHPIERAGDVGHEDLGVVVTVVEREPGGAPSDGFGQLRQQRRLAVAGWRDDRHDRDGRRLRDAFDECTAEDQRRAGRRRMELRLQEWECGPRPRGRFRVSELGQHDSRVRASEGPAETSPRTYLRAPARLSLRAERARMCPAQCPPGPGADVDGEGVVTGGTVVVGGVVGGSGGGGGTKPPSTAHI